VPRAQDLTQEFFAQVLEKRYLERAGRDKGAGLAGSVAETVPGSISR
jgi:hypothetical protein